MAETLVDLPPVSFQHFLLENVMRLYTLIALAALSMFAIGCDPSKDTAKNEDSKAKTKGSEHGHDHGRDHGHDHGHDHAHDHDHDHDHPAHGPNNGHIFPLESESMQAEWKEYKGNDEIRIFLLTKGEKPEAAFVKAESLNVIPLAGNDSTPFVLVAEDADADGKASKFMLEDAKLRVGIPLGVKIEIVTADGTITGEIKAHKPHGH